MGLLAGAIAETIGCPHNTLSSHLSILARAGLIRGTREGRTILYRADVEAMRALLASSLRIAARDTPSFAISLMRRVRPTATAYQQAPACEGSHHDQTGRR